MARVVGGVDEVTCGYWPSRMRSKERGSFGMVIVYIKLESNHCMTQSLGYKKLRLICLHKRDLIGQYILNGLFSLLRLSNFVVCNQLLAVDLAVFEEASVRRKQRQSTELLGRRCQIYPLNLDCRCLSANVPCHYRRDCCSEMSTTPSAGPIPPSE